MTTRKSSELMELVVAQLIAEGRSRMEIASKLEISTTRVSQLLKGNPHLTMVYEPSLTRGERDHLTQEASKLLGRAQLSEDISFLSPLETGVKVTVIYDRESEERTRPTFTKQTAQALAGCLKNSKNTGVCGGVTIKPQAKSASFFHARDPSKEKAIRFIPLCGFTHLKSEATRFSSTMVALRFEEIFNAKFDNLGNHPQNMNCLTLYSPYRKENGLAENELLDEGVRKYITTYFSGYEEIFLGNRRTAPLIDKVDTMITGVGAASQKQYAYLDPEKDGYIQFPSSTELPPMSIEHLKSDVICGDIGGIFLPKETSDEDQYTKKVVSYLNSRLTTLNAQHLSACANRANDSISKDSRTGNSGVICMAFGAHKKEAVLQSVRQGYVNQLIIDDVLADALKNSLTLGG